VHSRKNRSVDEIILHLLTVTVLPLMKSPPSPPWVARTWGVKPWGFVHGDRGGCRERSWGWNREDRGGWNRGFLSRWVLGVEWRETV